MKNLIRLFTILGAVLCIGSPAQAHLGHVGEIAGHAHWVGVGALVVAAALGALVLKPNKDNSTDDTEAEKNTEGESDEEPVS